MITVSPKQNLCHIEGASYPIVGFGTYRAKGEICTRAVLEAAAAGYRLIDTATYYNNFDGIANAFKHLDRSQFYLSSKVWPDHHTPNGLKEDLHHTLHHLKTDYLDAYFLHWPNSRISLTEALHTLDRFRDDKKIRHIGLSNVTAHHVQRALEVGILISWVQIEMHPFFYDRTLLDICKNHGITIQAWRPLALGKTATDPLLNQIGKTYKKTASQVALRWIIQHGCIPLPGSVTKAHIHHNFDVMDFSLSPEEMQQLSEHAAKGCRYRVLDPSRWGFTDEFDFSYEECWPIS